MQEEFAEAIGVKVNSDFVEHFFSLIDSDRNGYISFREFLNAVVLFSKGQPPLSVKSVKVSHPCPLKALRSATLVRESVTVSRPVSPSLFSNPFLSSVQFKIVSVCSEKSPYALNPVSQRLP